MRTARNIRLLAALGLSAAFGFACVPPAQADEIIFKNGDHLHGTIDSMEAGKMTISGTVAGKVTVDMKDVSTFSSTGTIALKLKDGTVTNQKVTAAGDGQVALAPGGAIQPQNVPLSNIKYVNYNENWTGHVTIGGTLARGNTETETVNIDIGAVRRSDKDRLTLEAGYLFGRERIPGDGKHETANDWFIGGKYDYFFTEQLYGYANARVERDVIAGIDLRVTPGAGVGYQFFDRPDFHLNAEGGLSYLYRSYAHDGTDDTVAARLAYHVDKKFNERLTLFHNFEYFPGLESFNNYYFDADAGLRASLTDKMFSEFKILHRYDSRPAPGKGHNDTRFILGVGWNF